MGISVKKSQQSGQDGTSCGSPFGFHRSGAGSRQQQLCGYFHVLRCHLQSNHQQTLPLHDRDKVRAKKQATVHQHSPFSWNFLSQLTKQNANQKLFQFVSQLKKIPVMLWNGKNVMKLFTPNVPTCWLLNHIRSMTKERNVLEKQIMRPEVDYKVDYGNKKSN